MNKIVYTSPAILAYVPLIVSALAFVISAATFYLNFIKKKYKVIVSVATDTFTSTDPLYFELSFCNAGNTNVLVTKFAMRFNDRLRKSYSGLKAKVLNMDLPIMLKPGDIVYVKLTGDINLVEHYSHFGYKQNGRLTFNIGLETTMTVATGKSKSSVFDIAEYLVFDNPTQVIASRTYNSHVQYLNLLSQAFLIN